MRINSIILIPGAGHSDNEGQYCRGVTTDSLSEVDVVDLYLAPLAEILEEYDIRHEVLPTRSKPGVKEAARLSFNEPGVLRIELSVGYFICGIYGKPRGRNESTVEYCGPRAFPLAEMLCTYLAEWGKNTSYGHCTRNPIANRDFAEGCIRLRPFAINGPDVETYMARATVLGRELGLALVEALAVSGEACRGRPIRA